MPFNHQDSRGNQEVRAGEQEPKVGTECVAGDRSGSLRLADPGRGGRARLSTCLWSRETLGRAETAVI